MARLVSGEVMYERKVNLGDYNSKTFSARIAWTAAEEDHFTESRDMQDEAADLAVRVVHARLGIGPAAMPHVVADPEIALPPAKTPRFRRTKAEMERDAAAVAGQAVMTEAMAVAVEAVYGEKKPPVVTGGHVVGMSPAEGDKLLEAIEVAAPVPETAPAPVAPRGDLLGAPEVEPEAPAELPDELSDANWYITSAKALNAAVVRIQDAPRCIKLIHAYGATQAGMIAADKRAAFLAELATLERVGK
jgi:hypothetical protein